LIKIKYEREFRNLPGKTRMMCYALTVNEMSGMRQALRLTKGRIRVWLAYQGKKVVGWSLMTWDSEVMIYVNRKYRRQGIGDALCRRAQTYSRRYMRGGREICVYPHDKTSYSFFHAMNATDMEIPEWAK